jgi:alkyldihydroxyacetonephosphate synthase
MTDRDAPSMRWWGWGDPNRPSALADHGLKFLQETVGAQLHPRPPVALERVGLTSSALSGDALQALREILGSDAVRDDHSQRVVHAAGKGYPDLVRLRAGEPEGAPDAVLYPSEHRQVSLVLDYCAQAGVAVVPFGGGTSVVGGLAPLRGNHSAVVALDLSNMNKVIKVDRESLIISVQAGLRAPALERSLALHNLTLGHFPQSFEYVSLGGCAATRSAGQASTGYGAIEKMVLGLRFAAPAGDIELAAIPASAAGPGLRQLIVGSEGTLGVISELALRVRRAPQQRIYEGVFFETFAAGVGALRALSQHHVAPDIARLSDEQETRMSLALAGSDTLKGRLGELYLRLRGYDEGCLAIFGFEGDEQELASRRKRTLALVRRYGGLAVGRSPGEAWAASRFQAPYLRDDLLGLGVMVETLETASTWSKLLSVHRAVKHAISQALVAQNTPGLVMCHVSHLYETGASLYFTFVASQLQGSEIEQWHAVKQAASQAIISSGGTITHHHAVGRDHAPWMKDEVGSQGVAVLRALKAELDPAAIMNPGKLIID